MVKDIVLCIDNNFILQVKVLIASLAKTNNDINIHIIGDNISLDNQNNIIRLCNIYNFGIEIYDLTQVLDSCNFTIVDNRWTRSIYSKLFIPIVLSNKISRCIYLDVDMIVIDNLDSLYRIDLDNYAMGMVRDCFEKIQCSRLSLTNYFNAGFILLNNNYWRNNNLTQEILKYSKNLDIKSLIYQEQDIINLFLGGKILRLSEKYNLQNAFLWKNASYFSDLKEINEITIIHFTGPYKPWGKICLNPFREKWIELAYKVEKFTPPLPQYKSRLIKKIIEIWIKYNPFTKYRENFRQNYRICTTYQNEWR